MNIKRLLKSNLLNPAEIARRFWPNAKDTDRNARLYRKIHEKNGQRLTEKDLAEIERILREEGEF